MFECFHVIELFFFFFFNRNKKHIRDIFQAECLFCIFKNTTDWKRLRKKRYEDVLQGTFSDGEAEEEYKNKHVIYSSELDSNTERPFTSVLDEQFDS